MLKTSRDQALSPQDRARLYETAFPTYPPVVASHGWLYGTWILGNNYKGSGYYGAYPPGYLKRVTSMFPEAKRVLHLFSGSLPPGDYVRFDCREELAPDALGQAHDLAAHFKVAEFDLVLADPPYSNEDADRYGSPMINRNKVMDQCAIIVRPGGNLVWLDQVLPMYRKSTWLYWGAIGIVRSTNHRFRIANFFQKRDCSDEPNCAMSRTHATGSPEGERQ